MVRADIKLILRLNVLSLVRFICHFRIRRRFLRTEYKNKIHEEKKKRRKSHDYILCSLQLIKIVEMKIYEKELTFIICYEVFIIRTF